MAEVTLTGRVRGASHISKNKPCEDFEKVITINDNVIVAAVADGHGSDVCTFSHFGAQCATEAFCSIVQELFSNNDEEFIIKKLRENNSEIFAKYVIEKWRRIIKDSPYCFSCGKTDEDGNSIVDWELYGTTLLGLIVTDSFVYALQIGDGDIIFISNEERTHIIEPPKFLGTETYSLSNKEPWKDSISYLQRFNYKDRTPCLFMMSTDGFSNSFINDDEYLVACEGYFQTIKEHGVEAIKPYLEKWLAITSENGCGDDITFVAIGSI